MHARILTHITPYMYTQINKEISNLVCSIYPNLEMCPLWEKCINLQLFLLVHCPLIWVILASCPLVNSSFRLQRNISGSRSPVWSGCPLCLVLRGQMDDWLGLQNSTQCGSLQEPGTLLEILGKCVEAHERFYHAFQSCVLLQRWPLSSATVTACVS